MEHVQPYQVLIPIVIAVAIGLYFLIFADRPHLNREIKRRLARQDYVASDTERAIEAGRKIEYIPYQEWANERTNELENPDEPALQSRTDEGTGAFVLNPDECAAVARMIEHKTTAEKPTKASAIWAGFGVKKGDSAKYKRASVIYDALFVAQPETTPIAGRPTDAKFFNNSALGRAKT